MYIRIYIYVYICRLLIYMYTRVYIVVVCIKCFVQIDAQLLRDSLDDQEQEEEKTPKALERSLLVDHGCGLKRRTDWALPVSFTAHSMLVIVCGKASSDSLP